MSWISEHADEVLAVIGSMFVFLRMLVALTPTPKDDQLLKKANTKFQTALGFISKVAGLDTTQGISSDKKLAPKATVLIVSCIMMLCVTGCKTVDPIIEAENGKLLLVQKSFSSAVNSLVVLNEAGLIDGKEQQRLTDVIHSVDTYLKEWETSNKVGVDRPDIIKYIGPLLIELQKKAGVKPLVNVNTLTP